MNNYKINSLSFSLIFGCLLNSSLMGMVFPYILNEAKTSIFISLGISFILGLFLIFIFLKILNSNPDKNIFEKLEHVLPKFIYIIISLLILLSVFLYTLAIFTRLTTFISSEFLTETPKIFIELILILPVIYMSLFDIDTLSRIATLAIIFSLSFFIFNFTSLISNIDLNNLKPLLNNSFIHLSKSSIIYTIFNIVPIFLLLIIPKNNIKDNNKLTKNIIITYLFSSIIVLLIIFAIVSVLGIDIANLYTFPTYVVLKTINIFSFISNIENLNILMWYVIISFSTGFAFVYIKIGLNKLLNINYQIEKKKNKTIIIIELLFIIIVAIILPKEIYINHKRNIYYIIAMYLPAAILSTIALKKKYK